MQGSIYHAVKYILIQLQSQGDNHAQADYNHTRADNRKVDFFQWNKDIMK
jgi:hypothetical protein